MCPSHEEEVIVAPQSVAHFGNLTSSAKFIRFRNKSWILVGYLSDPVSIFVLCSEIDSMSERDGSKYHQTLNGVVALNAEVLRTS